MRVYMFRHQHAGIVTSHVFASEPTEEQLAPLVAEAERVHGKSGWHRLHEAEFIDGDAVPTLEPASSGLRVASIADAPEFAISGAGTVG